MRFGDQSQPEISGSKHRCMSTWVSSEPRETIRGKGPDNGARPVILLDQQRRTYGLNSDAKCVANRRTRAIVRRKAARIAAEMNLR